MARRFARRKPKVVWLPVRGTASILSEYGADTAAIGFQNVFAVDPGGTITWDAVEITFDGSVSASTAQTAGDERSLDDLVGGQAYRLRRIVGKCFVGLATNTTTLGGPGVDVACGFIVCKTDANGVVNTDFITTNPLAQDSAEDPWIWRRRWILGNPTNSLSPDQAWIQNFPLSNAEYGSVADGPHIDQKTARIIGPQERLMFVIAARNPTSASLGPSELNVGVALDVRLLASLRTMQGNRRNASR